MTIRAYTDDDAAGTLAVFLAAVTQTASADYTPEQISAWAGADERDLASWHAARAARATVVAVLDAEVVGFTDVDDAGYVDMMFVDPAVVRRGVASALLDHVAATAVGHGARELSTHASVTARPFFERRGFVVVEERRPVVRGVALTNYRMVRTLG